MFLLLESKDEIAKAQRNLEATMAQAFAQRAKKNIGYPAGTTRDAKIFTDGTLWFWSADLRKPEIANPRRLNWFGLFTPERDLQITVEINTSYAARNDQVAGFFARDSDTGTVYLMHSGRVGGGTKGVGKAAFLAWSNQHPVEAADAEGEKRQGIIVMPVKGAGASQSAARYIDQIAKFKIAVRAGELELPEFKQKQKDFEDFYAEARGRRRGKRASKIDYLSRHGEAVDALYEWRRQIGLAPDQRLVKNVLIDLGCARGAALAEVFEVKTSATRSDLYAGIGQLLVHGSRKGCRRALVLPHDEAVPSDVREALTRLNITLLRFELSATAAFIRAPR
jgi:hypothetical protein